jgi:hypothetical protein
MYVAAAATAGFLLVYTAFEETHRDRRTHPA